MIIEDDSSYRNMMETMLQMEGFEVQSAADGQAGFALCHEKRPDLILCDIMMPEMDGHLVLENLKRNKNCADVPFIFISALGERGDVRRGMAEGADDYLPKPFSTDELLAAITARIHRREILLQQRNSSAFLPERNILATKITRREREILMLVGRGGTSR